jgi:light-regulated signal transduction histidine kinase (bacteriophytochrome)
VYPVVSTGLWGEAVRQRQPVFTNDYQAPNPLKRGYPEGHVHVGRHMNIPVFDGERIVAVAGVGNKAEPYDDSDVVQLQLLMGGMWRLLHRKQAAEDLRRAHDQLEQRVEERTAELARSNSELEQFAYIASHDLQEPLRKIVAFGDRLVTKHGAALPEEGHDYLARMQNAAQRMQNLINDLLAYSRVTTRAQAFVPVELDQVVQEVQSDLEVAIERSGGTIQAVDLPTLDADPLQMRQLFQNLISNALKFQRADAPPVVEITAELFTRETSGPWDMYPAIPMCRLKFKDNGIGFEPRHGERIFDIFQRLHTRDEYEGTGIGLALCRKIVERHGGSITATGEAGVGATFTVILPVKHAGGERTPLGT